MHMHKSVSFLESGTQFMSLKGTKIHWEIAVPAQKLLLCFFRKGMSRWGLFHMYAYNAFKWICKHEEHSHNINEK